MTTNESIPAPERSKEETKVRPDPTYRSPREDAAYFGSIWSLSTNQMAELEKTFEYHRDHHPSFGTDYPEGAPSSERASCTDPLADREKSATLETPPLHKEGEAVATINAQGGVLMTEAGEEWFKALRNMKAPLGQVAAYLYATPAPVPVPVTIPNEKWSDREPIYEAAMAAYEANTPKDYRYSAIAMVKAVDAAIAVIEAALSAKPGEQG